MNKNRLSRMYLSFHLISLSTLLKIKVLKMILCSLKNLICELMKEPPHYVEVLWQTCFPKPMTI